MRYTLEQEFIHDIYVNDSARKIRRKFWHVQDITIPHRETVHRNVKKLRKA
jgi:hypothetical protein